MTESINRRYKPKKKKDTSIKKHNCLEQKEEINISRYSDRPWKHHHILTEKGKHIHNGDSRLCCPVSKNTGGHKIPVRKILPMIIRFCWFFFNLSGII